MPYEQLTPDEMRRIAARWRKSSRTLLWSDPSAALELSRRAKELLQIAQEREAEQEKRRRRAQRP